MSLNLKQLKKEQLELSKKLVLFDSFEKSKIRKIAACDIAYYKNIIIVSFVVLDPDCSVIEKSYSESKIKLPYIPEFLSYRETPVIVNAYSKLKSDPDIVIIRRNGILHPRKMGVASHFGLLIDKPVIGISKDHAPGNLDNGTVYINKEATAKMLVTKEKAKPIFVSPGHKISLKTAVEIVKTMLKGHKMPEPLHIAHKFAVKVKHIKKKQENNYIKSRENIKAKENVPAGI